LGYQPIIAAEIFEMDKRLPFGFDNQDQRQADSSLKANHTSHLYQHSSTSDRRSGNLTPSQATNSSTHILILGGIFLQFVVIVAAFILFSPMESPSQDQDVEALHVPSTIGDQPALPPPRPFADDGTAAAPPSPTLMPTAAPTTPVPQPTPQPPPAESVALRWRGLEVTQGIQVFNEPERPECVPDPSHSNFIFCNNSIPLVAGRHTMLRTYPACNGECPPLDITIQLRLFKDGQELATLNRQLSAHTLQQINNLSLPDMRADLERSVNFELFPPPDWLVGQVTFELSAVPAYAVEAPAVSLTLTKDFIVRKPLRVAYVPIEYQGLTPPEPADIDYWLLRMYPVPAIEYYRLPIPNLTWQEQLSKGEMLNKLLFTYWLYAQYQPAAAWPDQLFGWLPQEYYNGGVSDPFWCPNCAGPHSSRVAFGGLRPEQDIGGPRILVHEIAHNLGAQHAWSPTQQEDSLCFKAEGADIQVDPAWPYAQTPNIQEFGIDLYSNPPVIYPPANYDMMAYCFQPWVSPFTYRKLFDSPFLQPDATAATLPLANFQPQTETSSRGTLLVSGVVYRDGTVSQPEIVRLEGDAFSGAGSGFSPPMFTPPTGDDYCLEIKAQDGAILAQHCFDVGFEDVENDQPVESSPFFFTLPQPEGGDIGQIAITKKNVVLVITEPSNTPPEITITFPNGGEVLSHQQTLTWEAFDGDGDLLVYDVLYSADGGQSWLPLVTRLTEPFHTFDVSEVPTSSSALIRVIASDGFHTTIDESDYTFTIEAAVPNSISLRSQATAQAGQTFEVAVVANQVTEPGLFGIQFKLHFDPTLLRVKELHLHPDLSLVAVEELDNDFGWVTVAASRQGRADNITGDITLATLTFTATSGNGDAYLYLSDIKAGARGGLRLDIADIRGLTLAISP
jgi:hypothetical protein